VQNNNPSSGGFADAERHHDRPSGGIRFTCSVSDDSTR